MKNLAPRLGALALALTLGAGFVAYRGGFFNRSPENAAYAADPQPIPPASKPSNSENAHQVLMLGSKSAAIVTPTPPATAKDSRVIFYTSKSGAIVEPPKPSEKAVEPYTLPIDVSKLSPAALFPQDATQATLPSAATLPLHGETAPSPQAPAQPRTIIGGSKTLIISPQYDAQSVISPKPLPIPIKPPATAPQTTTTMPK